MTSNTTAGLNACAEDLARRIDPQQEKALLRAWLDFYEGRCGDDSFIPPARVAAPPKIDWPDVHINDAQDDVDAMVLFELKKCSDVLARGGNALLNVRCNYGTGILPTLFGCELYTMPRETNTLPTARALPTPNAILPLLDAGRPDLRTGLGRLVFDTAERFLEVLGTHEELAAWVTLYHPDLQGPIDVVELIWGGEMFLAFYDQPEQVERLLDIVTDTYAAFMRHWEVLVPPRPDGYSFHWDYLIQGRLMIRNDSLMNLSPQIYTQFIRRFDQRLFDEFGGGVVHYCGRGDHFIEPLSEMTGLTGINLSQPHLNDMETIYRHTVDKGIHLIGLDRNEVARAKSIGRPLHGLVTC